LRLLGSSEEAEGKRNISPVNDALLLSWLIIEQCSASFAAGTTYSLQLKTLLLM
jgi:hypothetical protein